MAIVYAHKIKNSENIFYIGIGILEKRAFSIANRNNHWKNIVNKYGYDVEILFKDISYQDANLKETELILKYGRIDLKTGNLVNLTNGGDGVLGYKYTDKVKLKMSILKKEIPSPRKGVVLSQETKDKISNSKKGKKLSENHKLKISNANKGKKLSENHKTALLNSNINRVVSIETKLKMSQSKLKMSNETKIKIGFNNPKCKMVLNKYTGIFYYSLKEASFYECINYNTLKNITRKKGYNNKTDLIII
jgi:hypothetical protein